VASINIRKVDKEEFSNQELEELKPYMNEKSRLAFTGALRDGHGNELANPPRVRHSLDNAHQGRTSEEAKNVEGV